jgi:hypothetical protein
LKANNAGVVVLMAGSLLLSSCVTVQFLRRRAFDPVADGVLDELRQSHADLTTCLVRLGAPNLVYEQPDDGLALAWAWLDQFGWGINASINLRGVAISGDFDAEQRNLQGAVLFFDRELRLVDVDRGLLRDFLRAPSKRRPAAAE